MRGMGLTRAHVRRTVAVKTPTAKRAKPKSAAPTKHVIRVAPRVKTPAARKQPSAGR
mgnify:FL=1